MGTHESIRRDFVVIHSSWLAARAGDFARRADASFVVVVDDALPETLRYYVVARDEALDRLSAAAGARVRDALALDRDLLPAQAVALGMPVAEARAHRVSVGPQGLLGVIPGAEPVRRTRGGHGPPPPVVTGEYAMPADPGPWAAEPSTGAGLTRGGDAGMESFPARSAAPVQPPTVVTRHLGAELPQSIVVGETVSLLVSLQGVGGDGMPSAPMALAVGGKLDIVIKALEGLSVVGDAEGVLEVAEPQADLPLRMRLKAERVGPSGARVYAFHGAVSLASFVVGTQVVRGVGTGSGVASAEIARVTVVPRTQPDLALYIFEDGHTLTFRLQSADGEFHLNKYGPTLLQSSPRDHFRSFFRDIERLPLTTPQERVVARRKLEAKGAGLFEAVFPADLKVLLWDLRSRIHTV